VLTFLYFFFTNNRNTTLQFLASDLCIKRVFFISASSNTNGDMDNFIFNIPAHPPFLQNNYAIFFADDGNRVTQFLVLNSSQ
jgi:hypothetical protein